MSNTGATQNDALTDMARSKVPAEAVVTKYKTDHEDGETEIQFYDAATATTYEVTLYTNTKKIYVCNVSYLRIEIINTIHVAKAITNDNASYTLMLVTLLPQGKPNTSNYLMY